MPVVDELIAKLAFKVSGEQEAKKFERILDRLERRSRISTSGVERSARANTRALRREADYAQRHAAVIERANKKAAASSGVLAGAGGVAMRVGSRAVGAVGAGLLVKETLGAAISVEKALAEVQKHYDVSGVELAKMKAEIFDMVGELGKAPEQIAAVYAAAGKQGIPRNEVRDYAREVAKIAVAWDMSEAATANGLGTLKASLRIAQPELMKLAGTINVLADSMEGNVSEENLLLYLARVAGTGKALKGSAKSAAAIGAALQSAGDQPEVAATTFNSIMAKLATAKDGDGYKALGIKAKDLKAAMQKNADTGMMMFFDRVEKLAKDGKDVMGPLVDIFGTEYADNVLKFVNVLDIYRDAMRRIANDDAGVKGIERGYKIFSSTTNANIDRFKANLTTVLDTFGTELLPGVNAGIDRLNSFLLSIRKFRSDYAAEVEAIKRQGADWGTALFGSGQERKDATKRINDSFADSVVGGDGGWINSGLKWALPTDQRAAAEARWHARTQSVGGALGAGAAPIGARGSKAQRRIDGAWSAVSPVTKFTADVSSFLDPAGQAQKLAMDMATTITTKFTADLSGLEAGVARAKSLIGGVPSLSTSDFTGASTPARVAGAGAAP